MLDKSILHKGDTESPTCTDSSTDKFHEIYPKTYVEGTGDRWQETSDKTPKIQKKKNPTGKKENKKLREIKKNLNNSKQNLGAVHIHRTHE